MRLPSGCTLYNQSPFRRTGKGVCHCTGGKDCIALPGSESCQSVCSGDTGAVLAALSAQLTTASIGGTGSLPIGEFFTGKDESWPLRKRDSGPVIVCSPWERLRPTDIGNDWEHVR